jgi:hypothetical protein
MNRFLQSLRFQKDFEPEGGKMTQVSRRFSEMARKYSKSASRDVESAMRRKKKGKLKSGPGGKGGTVKSRKQAIAIGLSEARKKGKKVPKKKKSSRRKSA